jgi:hypothetical protein
MKTRDAKNASKPGYQLTTPSPLCWKLKLSWRSRSKTRSNGLSSATVSWGNCEPPRSERTDRAAIIRGRGEKETILDIIAQEISRGLREKSIDIEVKVGTDVSIDPRTAVTVEGVAAETTEIIDADTILDKT